MTKHAFDELLSLRGFDFRVRGTFYPGHPATRLDPEDPPEVEITDVLFHDSDLLPLLSETVVEELSDLVIERAANYREEARDEEAEQEHFARTHERTHERRGGW